ncbi:MAG: response regulator transcription factor [Planctomycetota bacterium]|jgi:two-component system alkaline phosphatase synthesis response regulator PhoP
MSQVLIVEDNLTLLGTLKDNLEYSGYQVETATNGLQGLEKALKSVPDLIMLDIMLPEMNGYEVCSKIRKNGLDVPIMMLTAKNEESDIVLGLDIGADDYLTKPFGLKELLARVKALIRRKQSGKRTQFVLGPYLLDKDAKKLSLAGKKVELTDYQYDLLCFLVEREGIVIDTHDMLRAVFGYTHFISVRDVEKLAESLKSILEDDLPDKRFIHKISKTSYKFEDC